MSENDRLQVITVKADEQHLREIAQRDEEIVRLRAIARREPFNAQNQPQIKTPTAPHRTFARGPGQALSDTLDECKRSLPKSPSVHASSLPTGRTPASPTFPTGLPPPTGGAYPHNFEIHSRHVTNHSRVRNACTWRAAN